jgi:hypothetical protein
VSDEESNLVKHARYELKLIGEDHETIEGYVKVIQAFADMHHSGGSASVAIPVINILLSFKPLSSLTNNPNEWTKISPERWPDGDMWQSKRNPAAFSPDGGISYYYVDEHPKRYYISEEAS